MHVGLSLSLSLSLFCLNPLKPSGYFVYQYICQSKILILLTEEAYISVFFVVLRMAIFFSVHNSYLIV